MENQLSFKVLSKKVTILIIKASKFFFGNVSNVVMIVCAIYFLIVKEP